jgi:hypothetical protein
MRRAVMNLAQVILALVLGLALVGGCVAVAPVPEPEPETVWVIEFEFRYTDQEVWCATWKESKEDRCL